MIMCMVILHLLMERKFNRFSLIMCGAILAMLMAPTAALALDDQGPVITDSTSGTPMTGADFLISAVVTDESSILFVKVYSMYFELPNGAITTPLSVDMDDIGGQFTAIVQVPLNASKLTYTILAKDSLNYSSITDRISWDVEDSQDPTASCESIIIMDMGAVYVFNGSESSDNVYIENYSWAFTYNSSAVVLYGVSPSFQFWTPDVYSGRLTVKDPWGNAGNCDFTVTVNDTEMPVSDAGISMYTVSGHQVSFDGTGSTDNVGIANYTWSIAYNGTVTLYGPTPSYPFWTSGVYNVTLAVTDAAGNRDTSLTTLEVISPPGDQSDTEDEGSNWWVYVLVAIIVIFIILAILILRN